LGNNVTAAPLTAVISLAALATTPVATIVSAANNDSGADSSPDDFNSTLKLIAAIIL
jgi:hypothetical protein